MRYRRLGSSNLEVSEIALGSWLTYGVGIDNNRASACVRQALDLGINFIDTANIYGRGEAETLLGEALAGVPRDSYILATKLFFPMTSTDHGLSRTQIFKQLDASLARLKTDYVDLYQCHRYDPETPLEETMSALSEVVRQGKVRFIGFSEWPADKIRAALAMTGVEKFVSSQPQYSLLWPKPEEIIFPLCRENGISQIVWSPLAQGVLTGKYLPDKPVPADSRAASPSMNSFLASGKDWLTKPVLEAVQSLKPLATKASLSLGQFALAWVLRRDDVAAAIIGATRPEQVIENAAVSGRVVDPSLFAEAETIVAPFRARTS
jgi:aryl-alcohol dehydrogenase-like predicted oxidoreductase